MVAGWELPQPAFHHLTLFITFDNTEIFKMSSWIISRYSRRHPRFGFINIVADRGGWSVRFTNVSDVQNAFDGGSSKYRLFETPEEAQAAVDAFKYDGVIWEFTPTSDIENAYYEAEIDGVEFTVTLTDNFDGDETWELTECSNDDFWGWFQDGDAMDKDPCDNYWNNSREARKEVEALWTQYQTFCAQHGSYEAFVEAETV